MVGLCVCKYDYTEKGGVKTQMNYNHRRRYGYLNNLMHPP